MSQNHLKALRKTLNIGQTELAELAGVSKQLIWGFENGRNGVSPQVLRRLAEILKVTPGQILTGKAEEKKFNDQDKELLLKSISAVNDYYKDYNFESEMMAKISAELYSFMADYKTLEAELNSESFNKTLNDKIASGLAAKCFLNLEKDGI